MRPLAFSWSSFARRVWMSAPAAGAVGGVTVGPGPGAAAAWGETTEISEMAGAALSRAPGAWPGTYPAGGAVGGAAGSVVGTWAPPAGGTSSWGFRLLRMKRRSRRTTATTMAIRARIHHGNGAGCGWVTVAWRVTS